MRQAGLLVSLIAAQNCRTQDHCEDNVSTLESLTDETPQGVSGAQLLATAQGVHGGTLRWTPIEAQGGAVVTTNVEVEASELTVEIAYDGGEIRFVDSRRVDGTALQQNDVAIFCNDRIEVDVRVTVSTTDGLLSGVVVAPLVLGLDIPLEDESDTRPTSLSIELDELDGTLEILAVDPPDPNALELHLNLQFDAGRLDASIDGIAIYTGSSPGGCGNGDAGGGSGTAGTVDVARLDPPSTSGGTDTGVDSTTDGTTG